MDIFIVTKKRNVRVRWTFRWTNFRKKSTIEIGINTEKCVLMPKKCGINTLYYHVFALKIARNPLKKWDLVQKIA